MTNYMLPLPGLSPVSGKTVVAKFDGGLLSSDTARRSVGTGSRTSPVPTWPASTMNTGITHTRPTGSLAVSERDFALNFEYERTIAQGGESYIWMIIGRVRVYRRLATPGG